MPSPSSSAHREEPQPASFAPDSTEMHDDAASNSNPASSDIVSLDCDYVDDDEEFHEEEFLGILALAEVAEKAYAASSKTEDLEEYIAYLRDALMVAPRDGFARAKLLHRLAANLSAAVAKGSFVKGGAAERLDECVSLNRRALDCLPAGHDDRALYVTQLASALHQRYVYASGTEDLQECIAWHYTSLSLRPSGHPDRAESLANLADACWTRFGRIGDVGDLDETIRFEEEALALDPPRIADKVNNLLNLAADLGARFTKVGIIKDLERAITLGREALQLMATAEDRLHAVQQLASHLLVFHRATNGYSSFEEAVTLCLQGLEFANQVGSSAYPIVRVLADTYLARCTQQPRDPHDVEDAIRYCRLALASLPATGNIDDKMDALSNLASALMVRSMQLHVAEDSDEAIRLYTQVADICTSTHLRYSRHLRDLARAYATRYVTFKRKSDARDAFKYYAQATHNPHGLVGERAAFGREWVGLLIRCGSHPQEVLSAYTSVMALFRLACLDSDARERALKGVSELSDELTVHFLSLPDVEKSVEVLEQARELIWSARDLMSTVPTTFQARLRWIVRELTGSEQSFPTACATLRRPLCHETRSDRESLASELDSILDYIRMCPGMSSFLQPMKYADIATGPGAGAVVLLVARPRCEAVMFSSAFVGARQILLPTTVEEVQQLANGFSWLRRHPSDEVCSDLLERTWLGLVAPILDALSLQPFISGNIPKPRIWWCPTGPFTLIPLHAAGQYRTGSQTISATDCIVSSYTPTITALRAAQQRQRNNSHAVAIAGVTLTSDISKRDELMYTQEPSPSSSTDSSGYSPMTPHCSDNCSVAHLLHHPPRGTFTQFTCVSGINMDLLQATDNMDLSRGKMLTPTAITDVDSGPPASLRTFSSIDVHHASTAPSDVDSLMPLAGELSQLGSTLLYRGYGSVIDTIPSWPMNTCESEMALIIEHVRGEIFAQSSTDPDYTVVPYALDRAIRGLRDSGTPLTHWIPFIHIGR